MSIDTNDPRLTAFALEELDESERAEIEALLENDPEALREIDQIRDIGALLAEELAAEPSPGLTDEQRQALEAEFAADEGGPVRLDEVRAKRKSRLKSAAIMVPLTLAAGLTVAMGGYLLLAPGSKKDAPAISAAAKSAEDMDRADEAPPEEVPVRGVAGDKVQAEAKEPASAEWEAGEGDEEKATVAGRRSDSKKKRLKRAFVLQDPTAGTEAPGSSIGFTAKGSADKPAETAPAPEMPSPAKAPPPSTEPAPATGPPPPARIAPTGGDGQARMIAALDKKKEEGKGRPHTVTTTKPGYDPGSVVVATPPAPTPPTVALNLKQPERERSQPTRRKDASRPGQGGGGALYAEGLRAYQAGDLSRAMAVFQSAADKGNAEALKQLATVHLQQGRTKDAIAAFQRYLGRQPRDADAIRGIIQRLGGEAPGSESYDPTPENPFLSVAQEPLSTFSIDVDTASYSNVRRFLTRHMLPPRDAVRIEEMINYFRYDYGGPRDDKPFAVHVDAAKSPWSPGKQLVRIGIKGREIEQGKRPAANLVFLIDVSGSMSSPNKLPLLKNALKLLVAQLDSDDRVAMVVYAGAAGMVLDSTPCDRKDEIVAAIDRLSSGGSTNAGDGIKLAYELAVANIVEGGVNRVVLATDGDFNVGITSRGGLDTLIKKKAKSGVFLTVLGFGMGNYKDGTLEALADKGNGNYAYIDTMREARKVLVDQVGGTLVTIAKDVKIQVEFNPAKVSSYRLVGYVDRKLANRDFADDTKDAGEIGAGHTVTALYEIIPAGGATTAKAEPSLKYRPVAPPETGSDELLTVKLRYKEPTGHTSKLLEFPLEGEARRLDQVDLDFRWAATVAAFGMKLRGSDYAGKITFEGILEMANAAKGGDPAGYRGELVELVRKAQQLMKR